MDLISFEDLVVQPYNSYFNLEKELHDVKAKLSLMEQRLKYLEEKIGYGCKGNLTLEEKIEVLDIKYEELDDEICILQDDLLKDIKTIDDKVKEDTNIIRSIRLGVAESGDSGYLQSKVDRHCVDNITSITLNLESLITYVSTYNVIKVLSSNISKHLNRFLRWNRVKIEKLNINADICNFEDFKNFIDAFIKHNLIEKNIKFSGRLFSKDKEIEIEKLKGYCVENNIELDLGRNILRGNETN